MSNDRASSEAGRSERPPGVSTGSPSGAAGAGASSLPPKPSGANPRSAFPGEPSTRPASVAAIRPWQLIGGSFDALIRSVRLNPSASADIAGRGAENWRLYPDSVMELRSTEIVVSGQIALAGNADEGHWILPAFMAGLRTIKPRPGAGGNDFARLAEEMAQLEPNNQVIEAFRDWLWADGAEGFDIGLHTSFMEVMEAITAEDAARQNLAAVRDGAARQLGGAVMLASQDLDAAAMREEFDVPLELFQQAVSEPSFQVGDDAIRALRAECDSSFTWASAEVAAVLGRTEIRAAMPAQRLARQLVSILSEHVDARTLSLLESLEKRDDPYTAALSASLDDESLGESLARKISGDAASLGVLGRYLTKCPPRIGRGIAHGLLDRASTDSVALDVTANLALSVGPAKFRAHVDQTKLKEATALGLVRVLLRARATAADIQEVLAGLPPEVAASVLPTLKPEQFWEMSAFVSKLLATGSARIVEELLPVLMTSDHPQAAVLVAEALRTSEGKDWDTKLLHSVCQLLIKRGLAQTNLVPLFRTRSVEDRVRLYILTALREVPAAFEDAVRWRVTEWFDSPEVRNRLVEVRKQLADGRKREPKA